MAHKERTFGGFASRYGEDLGGDVVLPGAYRETLAAFHKGRLIPLIDSHDSSSSVRAVLGHVIQLQEQEHGLYAKFKVVQGVDGDELLNRLRAGSVSGLSIGYTVPLGGSKRLPGGGRELSTIDLREISAVVFPMCETARITSVEGEKTAAAKALAAAVTDTGAPDMRLFRKLVAQCATMEG